MNHEQYVKSKRLEALFLAQKMLSGEEHLLGGVRKLYELKHDLELNKTLFDYFTAVESETDHFPLDAAFREKCSKEYLDRIDSEIENYLIEEKANVEDACRNLIEALQKICVQGSADDA